MKQHYSHHTQIPAVAVLHVSVSDPLCPADQWVSSRRLKAPASTDRAAAACFHVDKLCGGHR